MKRILLLSALLAGALVSSCNPNNDPELPSVSWASNPKFSQMELAPGADGNVSISAPGGLESLTLGIGLGSYNLVVNPYISVSANKGSGTKSPILDVIDDPESASFLNSLGIAAGTGLRGKTLTTMDLLAIVEKLLTGQELSNNSVFTIDINILDKNANSISKTAKFHFTSAPSFSWDGNKTFDIVDITKDDFNAYKVKVNAPGKIDKLTIKLESGADAELAKKIQNRTTGGILTIDLVNDELVATEFKNWFPTGKSVSGKTDVSLDFSFMKDWRSDLGPSTNVFTIFVEDANAKTSSTQVKFKK
ncbi:MAG: hypothetical protein J5759_00055 [Bacteroidales bacterium]|nr:hypothetical protein [Bacteroidales bacterium]